MHSFRCSCAGLIFSLLLFASVARAQEIPSVPGSQEYTFSRPSRPTKLTGTGQAQQAEPASAVFDYSYSVLYNFCSSIGSGGYCTDGQTPYAGVIQDTDGNLYGTTNGGGANLDTGVVFKVDTTGHETVLYSFCSEANCADGENPNGGLIQDAKGNLYGTTKGGGAHGIGTVFMVDTAGHHTLLLSFGAGAGVDDGGSPSGDLLMDALGNLYGTTYLGARGYGALYKLDATGHVTVLHTFCSVSACADGANPGGSLIQDSAGNLYGTTKHGGTGTYGYKDGGTVFKLDTSGSLTVLYNFCSAGTSAGVCTDGEYPNAGLVRDAAGNLYGTTSVGGVGAYGKAGYNGGTVFRVDSEGHETVLYSFCSVANCTDGASPGAGLIQDAAGNLYGTTGGGAYGGGTVFKLDIAGNETVLHSFCAVRVSRPDGYGDCTDGAGPMAGLIQDAAGNLYGTTDQGGAGPYIVGNNLGGTVFKLSAPVVGTQTQTITFPNPGPLTYGVGSITLSATASSGLPVSLAATSVTPAGIASLSGDTLTITGAGAVTVQATQAGNSTYAAATPVSDVIVVSQAPLLVVCSNVSVNYGWPIPPLPVSLTGVVAGDGIAASCTTSAVEGSAAGTYTITPALSDSKGKLPDYSVTKTNGTLTIGTAATSVPLLLSLTPGSATAGGAAFKLTVTGADFASKSVVLWNGQVRATTYVSSAQLTATILASDLAKEEICLITVASPAPDAATSAALPFVVMSSTPNAAISAVVIADAADGSGDHVVGLTGSDFVSASTIHWNGTALTTSYVSPWQIAATIPSADLGSPATVTVENPAGTSLAFEVK